MIYIHHPSWLFKESVSSLSCGRAVIQSATPCCLPYSAILRLRKAELYRAFIWEPSHEGLTCNDAINSHGHSASDVGGSFTTTRGILPDVSTNSSDWNYIIVHYYSPDLVKQHSTVQQDRVMPLLLCFGICGSGPPSSVLEREAHARDPKNSVIAKSSSQAQELASA